MTAGTEQVLGNDRVRSETVGFCTSQMQLGHEQRLAADLHHVHTQLVNSSSAWRNVINTDERILRECTYWFINKSCRNISCMTSTQC